MDRGLGERLFKFAIDVIKFLRKIIIMWQNIQLVLNLFRVLYCAKQEDFRINFKQNI